MDEESAAELKEIETQEISETISIESLQKLSLVCDGDENNGADNHIDKEHISIDKSKSIEIEYGAELDLKVIHKGDGDGDGCGGELGETSTYPSAGDVVKIHLTISTSNTSNKPQCIIQNSRNRKPFTFVMGKDQVIRGFELALKRMRRGEVVEVLIQSKYAYGEVGFGNCIPPGEDLYCRIELLEFYKYEAPKRPLIVHLTPPTNI